MVGLKGSRVVVIEDVETEALPIIKAFSKKGIPVAFFSGRHDEAPTRDMRLVGVRLAILDMDIVGGGTNDRNIVSALVNFLKKVLSPDNGPYIMIAWTNRPELVDLLDTRLFSAADIPTPISILRIEKAECKRDGDFDLAVVSEKLKVELSNFSPLLFLQAWEERCYLAATEVTNELSKLTDSEISPAVGSDKAASWRQSWKTKLLQLMYSMAKEAYGANITSGEVALSAFYNSMNPLHADRIERHSTDAAGLFKGNRDELLAPDSRKEYGIGPKARINTMMHVACERLNDFQAGNVYRMEKRKTLFLDGLVDDIFQGNKNDAAEWIKLKEEITNCSYPVLVEINPICDHAQGNVRVGRLVAGYLVPANYKKRIKNAAFIWSGGYGPLHLEIKGVSNGNYYLCISARHLKSVDVKKIKKKSPIMRLRGQAFSDLQAWFGHHAARPGMILMREK